MATISKLKSGQLLYSVTRVKMGNTTMSRLAVHPVKVIEIDPDGMFVLASWNSNPARKYFPGQVAKWKVNMPARKV